MTGSLAWEEIQLEPAEKVALAYAPLKLRQSFAVLLQLDARLARIALATAEPMLAQVKLAWWRDALQDPADEAAAHPLVGAVARDDAIDPTHLTLLVDAWEAIVAGQGDGLDKVRKLAGARTEIWASVAGLPTHPNVETAALFWTAGELYARAPAVFPRGDFAGLLERETITALPRALRPLAVLGGLGRRALERGTAMLGDRGAALVALRLGIFGR